MLATYFKSKILSLLNAKNVAYVALLAAIIVLAATIRLQPVKYGFYLYEYDPYFMYWFTKQLVDHGPGRWFELTAENVKNFWYPWGRNVITSEYPGVPFLGYFAYHVASLFMWGLSEEEKLMIVCVILPVIAGVLEVLAAFLIGREIKDVKTGLFAAFITAVLPSAIDRTIAGFYTKLGFGVMLFLYSTLFYIKMLKEVKFRTKLIYSSLAGIFLGLVGFTWGGYAYTVLVFAAYGLLIVLLGLNSKNFALNHAIILVTALVIFVLTPRIGFKVFTTLPGISIAISLLAVFLDLMLMRKGFSRTKRLLTLTGIAAALGGIYAVLVYQGLIKMLPGRMLSIMFPWLRGKYVLFASVAEHAALSWDFIFYHLSPVFFLIPIGLLYMVLDRSKERYLVFIAAITSIYGFTSAAYLAHLAGPLAAIAGAYGLSKLLDVFITELTKKPPRKKKVKTFVKIDPIPIMAVIVLLLIVIAITVPVGIRAGDVAPTIISPQMISRGKNTAWIQALQYIKESTPPNAVIASWWDYGYHTAIVGNRTSVCDNATLNATQIRLMAWALMGNESYAADIFLKKFKMPPNASYVLVFEVFRRYWHRMLGRYVLAPGRGGDISKSVAIISVGGLNISEYYDPRTGYLNWFSNKTRSALLFRLLAWGAYNVSLELGVPLYLGGYPFESLGFEPLQIFEIEKVFYDTTEYGDMDIIVIVVLAKLNYQKYLEVQGQTS
mgnify:CR=1 FL=1